MNAKSIIDSVKEQSADAKEKIQLAAAHTPALIESGKQTLHAAKEVVDTARREAKDLVSRTTDELKRTLKEGVAQFSDRVAHLATPTRKELAATRKGEVRAKKQRKRAEAQTQDDAQTGVETKDDAPSPPKEQASDSTASAAHAS